MEVSSIGAQFAIIFRRAVRLAFLLLCFCTVSPASSADLPRLYVQPDRSVVVAMSEKPMKLEATSSDAVKLTTDAIGGAQPKLWIISYKAPPAKDATEVAITYSIGSEKYSVIIQVSATPQPDSSTLASAATILGQMLVIAIVMESAFAVIFNWRVFLEFFDGRGVRTLVMFAGGWTVANVMHQDFVGTLFDVYLRTGDGNDQHTTWTTQVLTALVLAGGSASVNQLFVALNLREAKTAESVTERAPPNKAWIAIKVTNIKKGDKITIVDAAKGEAPTPATEHLVGIMPAAGVGERIKKYFWRDRNRLPMSRGFVVDPDKEYAFVIRCTRQNGDHSLTTNLDLTGTLLNATSDSNKSLALEDVGSVPVSQLTPLPRRYSFAKGAVIDFRVRIPK